jgi:hypothetical protein
MKSAAKTVAAWSGSSAGIAAVEHGYHQIGQRRNSCQEKYWNQRYRI